MIYIATQNVRLSVNGRSVELQAGQPCELSDEEVNFLAPGLLVPSTQTETISTEVPSENDEAPRFEKKKGKK